MYVHIHLHTTLTVSVLPTCNTSISQNHFLGIKLSFFFLVILIFENDMQAKECSTQFFHDKSSMIVILHIRYQIQYRVL